MDVPSDQRAGGLLAWQHAGYSENHTDRRNLLIHAFTTPISWSRTSAMVASPFITWWLAPAGLSAAAFAMALQGRGHKMEPKASVPFLGPLDVVARIFAEQWITFPRFLFGGGFARAWRQAARSQAKT